MPRVERGEPHLCCPERGQAGEAPTDAKNISLSIAEITRNITPESMENALRKFYKIKRNGRCAFNSFRGRPR
ncbi:hypothetical protein E2C01_022855 [Portunus trituberculatus]|uniref:Uncharacterized protein n=1 Tax=Portunus trituberculatus TaxID=210409 RepID=A0A5B7EA09_PORTR|nr:hypothetical protein [Portunus trituberculatus]